MAAPGDPSALLGLFQGGLTKLAASFTVVTNAVQSFGSTLGQFVGLFNPAVVAQFNYAARDMMAVIGQMLTPVMRAAIPVVRFLGDLFDGIRKAVEPLVTSGLNLLKPILDVLGQTIQQLAGQALTIMIPVWQQIAQVFAELVPALAPILNIITRLAGMLLTFQSVALNAFLVPLRLIMPLLGLAASLLSELMAPFTELATTVGQIVGLFAQLAGELAGELGKLLTELIGVVLQPLISAFRYLVGVLRDVLAAVRAFFGLKDLAPVELGNSRGKAIAQTGVTDAKGLITKLQTSAFALGGGDPARETAKNTDASRGILGNIKQVLDEMPGKITAYVDEQINGVKVYIAGVVVEAARVINPLNAADVLARPFR